MYVYGITNVIIYIYRETLAVAQSFPILVNAEHPANCISNDIMLNVFIFLCFILILCCSLHTFKRAREKIIRCIWLPCYCF